jgi:hypothetical protein
MLPLKDKIGTRSETHTEVVTADRIAAFCKSVGVTNHEEAPPTFLTVFRRGEFELLQVLGLDLSNALHADQQYDIVQPIRAGDHVLFETEVSQVLEKLSPKQSLRFLTLETRFQIKTPGSQGHPGEFQPMGKSICTLVFRQVLDQK